jgi:competence protein ComGC
MTYASCMVAVCLVCVKFACSGASVLVDFLQARRSLAEEGVQERVQPNSMIPARTHCARGFTLIDVFTSMAVIMLLIAILLPSLSTVRETARRVVCGSNVRQIGLGIGMYASDYDGFLPPSRFNLPAGIAVHQTTLVRAVTPAVATGLTTWDGLGILYQSDYLMAPGVFYCPSHHGNHPFALYASQWPNVGTELFANYQFRVSGSSILEDNSDEALIADALRTQADFNHTVGCNFLRRDLSTTWYTDSIRTLVDRLPLSEADAEAAELVGDAWRLLDSVDANGDPR